MKITHDKTADAIYITLKKGIVASTSKMKNNIIVDMDEHGSILGIEILHASVHIANKKAIDFNVKIPALI